MYIFALISIFVLLIIITFEIQRQSHGYSWNSRGKRINNITTKLTDHQYKRNNKIPSHKKLVRCFKDKLDMVFLQEVKCVGFELKFKMS